MPPGIRKELLASAPRVSSAPDTQRLVIYPPATSSQSVTTRSAPLRLTEYGVPQVGSSSLKTTPNNKQGELHRQLILDFTQHSAGVQPIHMAAEDVPPQRCFAQR